MPSDLNLRWPLSFKSLILGSSILRRSGEEAANTFLVSEKLMSASLIIVLTHTGKLARLFSKQRGPVPVMAFVDDAKVGRQLMLERGLHPVFQELQRDVSQDRPKQAVRKARELGFVKPGDTVTIVLSEPASSVLSRTITTRVAFVE